MILKHRMEDTIVEAKSWEKDCELQAEILVRNFRAERIHLQKNWFDEMARKGKQMGTHKIGGWCPLNLFARLHNGSLQIYWQLVYRNRLTGQIGYKHLAKTRAGGYDLRTLLKHAHDFEREHVSEYEEEAQIQRMRWKELTHLNRHLTKMLEHNNTEGVLMKRVRARTEAIERARAGLLGSTQY